jgi:uncharacterized protein YndB with AHSA1/START domain
MTLVERTAPEQSQALAFEFELPHKPEKIWRALTEPQLLEKWLLPAIGLKLEPGAEFMYKTQPYPGWDGTVNCQFIEIDPNRKLQYKWSVPFLETVVTFSLAPIDSGTRLTIVQTGFNENQKREFGGARYGWRMMGEKLIGLLETTP